MNAIAYHTSKGAITMLTKDLAIKWASKNINVNAIAPGWFMTHMSKSVLNDPKRNIIAKIPLARFGGENDLMGAAIFLASDASNYVTGHVLVVDGGYTCW